MEQAKNYQSLPAVPPAHPGRPWALTAALGAVLLIWLAWIGTPAVHGQATATPTPGPLRFEDTDPSMTYAGAWTTVSAPAASGGTVHRSNELGATASLTFTGTSVTWVTSRGPDRGIARVVIDGAVRDMVDLHRGNEQFQEELTFSGLAEGQHVIRIEVTGTRSGGASNTYVDVDAFVVSSAPTTPVPTNTPTATSTATSTGTGTPVAATSTPAPPTATPTPGAVPPAPPAPHDARYFFETSFRIDYDPFWDYFNARGGITSFGFPVSRTFAFLGCTTQFFQRQLMQQCGTGAPVQTMNILDPELMPYNQINFSIFPTHDPTVAGAAPAPGTPNYGQAVLTYMQQTAPDTFQGLPVRFYTTFVTTVPGVNPATDPNLAALVNLEIWGFPTSNPAFDPNNRGFVYQRFQRGIMHFDASSGATRGILLSDYFKGIIMGRPGPTLPPDLALQATGGRFLAQYCPGLPNWVCRPNDLAGTDLTFAFEPQ